MPTDRIRIRLCAVVALLMGMWLVVDHSAAQEKDRPINDSPYARWQNGPSNGPGFFPIAVWLQDPRNAAKYQAIGINLYVALWKGPTAEQIAELKRHGMPVICEQNDYALKHLDEKTIVGWMHGDEPDNAQSLRPKARATARRSRPRRSSRTIARSRQNDPTPAGDAQSRPGRGLGRLVRPRRADQSSRRLRRSTSAAATSSPSTSIRPSTTSRPWPASCGMWPGASSGCGAGPAATGSCGTASNVRGSATRRSSPRPSRSRPRCGCRSSTARRGSSTSATSSNRDSSRRASWPTRRWPAPWGRSTGEIQSLAPVINSPSLPNAATVTVSPTEGFGRHGQAPRRRRGLPLRRRSTKDQRTSSPFAWKTVRPRALSDWKACRAMQESRSSAKTAPSRPVLAASRTTSLRTASTCIK